MNYIVLNGVKSTMIQGLLIQSLPPVSKPLMRTSIEEIDGRDGDVVTKLGYSAYDKEISIGLFGDYDVDEVIEFFDSEGSVIFSNEPDKLYKYQIIDQIDLERLVKFKTATVIFHVQPFKYSAVEDKVVYSKDKMNVNVYSAQKNGVTLSVQNDLITVSGTASVDTEFYVPIKAMTLGAGSYTLKATTEGTGESCGSIRVIDSVPTDADSLGGSDLDLEDSGVATLSATVTEEKTFHYVWIYLESGTVMDYTLKVEVLADGESSFKVFNRGNTISRPTVTIYGSDTIKLSINSVELFTISLGNAGYITLDGVEMNAYKGNTLMNRLVVGDYSNLTLKQGTNIISWTGTVTEVDVENVTRWI